MKQIFSILLCLFFAQIEAQTIIPSEDYFDHNSENNVYFKDVNHIYDKFLGNWVYSDGPHYLRIMVTKKTKVEDGVSSTGRRYKTRKQ